MRCLSLMLMSVALAVGPALAVDDPAAPVAPAVAEGATPAAETAAVPVAADAHASTGVAPGDADALRAMFRASAAETLMGTAMEEHAKHLLALLEEWGDRAYADVLATTDSSAVTSTQGLLEFAGASRSKYPRTFATKAKS